MVVYWDLVALWNFALDYILLLGAARLAGLPARRPRLALAAALGAAYAALTLSAPFSPWGLAAAMLVMCLAAFGRTERYGKLTLLFALLACGLGGAVLLMGRCFGGAKRLAYGVLYARLPWGVFFAAGALSWLLLTFVFRNGAKHTGGELVRARIEAGGKAVTLTLFRDTGNTLSDPLTGEGVPVVWREALAPLLTDDTAYTALRCRTVSAAEGTLWAFRCDRLTVDGRTLGARLIALSPHPLGDGGGYQGLWYDEEREETRRHEVEASLG